MAQQLILLDTSILIDFYRKTDKANSAWIKLGRRGYRFAISVITKYEIYTGAKDSQTAFWNEVLALVENHFVRY